LTVKDDAGSVVSCTGHDPADAVIIRFVADADSVVTYEDDDTAWLGSWSNHSKLFGKIRSGQLYVSVNFEVLRDMNMTTKDAGETTAGVYGSDGGRPALSLGINTYRASAGARNTRPRFALAKNTRESLALADPMNSFAIASAHRKNSRSITGVNRAHCGGPALSFRVDTDRSVAGGRNTRSRFALAQNAGEAVAFANPMNSFAVAFANPEDSRTISQMDAPHCGGSTFSLSIDAY
jgi:hypothetical protein